MAMDSHFLVSFAVCCCLACSGNSARSASGPGDAKEIEWNTARESTPKAVDWALDVLPAEAAMLVLDWEAASASELGRATTALIVKGNADSVEGLSDAVYGLEECELFAMPQVSAVAISLRDELAPNVSSGTMGTGRGAVAFRGLSSPLLEECLAIDAVTTAPGSLWRYPVSDSEPGVHGRWSDNGSLLLSPQVEAFSAPVARTDSVMSDLSSRLPKAAFLWIFGRPGPDLRAMGVDAIYFAYDRSGKSQYYTLRFSDRDRASVFASARETDFAKESADPNSPDFESVFDVEHSGFYVMLKETYSPEKLKRFLSSISQTN